MKLDYSVLHEPISVIDTTNYFRWRQSQKVGSSMWNRELSYTALGGSFLLLVGLFAVTLGLLKLLHRFYVLPDVLSGLLSVLIPAGIMLMLVVAAARRWRSRLSDRLVRQYKFAANNGLIYKEDVSDPSHQGIIFGRGRSRRLVASYTFPDGTQIGNYRYLEQRGRYEEERNWGFVSMPLPRNLPHMLLDSRANNLFGGRISSLPDDLKGHTLSLEGNFDKYFRLYVPKQHERDALYVFTPDVMATMIDFGQAYDIEVVGNRLLLYREGYFDLDLASDISGSMAIADTIRSEVHHQARRYSAE